MSSDDRGAYPSPAADSAGRADPSPAGADETVIDLQLQAMAFESAIRYAERVVPRSLLEFLA